MAKVLDELTGACPVGFLAFLPRVIAAAHKMGYAIAVHGSMKRDLDLIACPWVTKAATAEELVEAIREAVGGFMLNDGTDPNDYTRRNPQPMAHGRLAWSIHLGGGPYIDLSVMPRIVETQDQCL